MIINETGNIWIGTLTPNQKLDVAGNISVSGVLKIGTQTVCGAGDIGAIRYVGGAIPYECCDGGGTWLPFKQSACGDDDTAGCYIDTIRSNSDPDFIAANIADSITILGVTGTLTCGGGGGGDGPLYNGVHLESECLADGGQVAVIGVETICDFAGSSCPSGWTAYSGMIKTSAKYCPGQYGGSQCSCTTGAHTIWASNRETCTYHTKANRGVCQPTYSGTCYANITNVACY